MQQTMLRKADVYVNLLSQPMHLENLLGCEEQIVQLHNKNTTMHRKAGVWL
jgi:hypothetical protein